VIAVDDVNAAEDPIAMLAEQIAERLALRLGPQLTRLAGSAPPSPGPALWTARRVASHYGVGVSFIYQHADELGCLRLGGGSCARLRFDPAIVSARWPEMGTALPVEGRQRRHSKSRRRPTVQHQDDDDLLLEFDREL
jgi:hypothetical protein